MTDKTATQNLTRPTSGDDPRRLDEWVRALAVDADQRVTAHLADLNRSITPPFAHACLTVATQINADGNIIAPGAAYPGQIPFDTVQQDTAGMIDLSADPYTIYLPEPGYYWVGGYALMNGFGAGNGDNYATVHAAGFNFPDPRHDGGFGFVGSSPSGEVRVTSVASARPAALTVAWSGPAATTITTVFFAELWVLKVRDL